MTTTSPPSVLEATQQGPCLAGVPHDVDADNWPVVGPGEIGDDRPGVCLGRRR